jgi:phosphoglycolate phosphatase
MKITPWNIEIDCVLSPAHRPASTSDIDHRVFVKSPENQPPGLMLPANRRNSTPAPNATKVFMTKPSVIVFDLDGTLVDTAPDIAQTMNVLLARRGRGRLEVGQVRRFVGQGARVLMTRAMAATGETAQDDELAVMFEEFLVHYGANIADHSAPYPGVVAALKKYRAADVIMAVCTNKHEALSRLLLDKLGLSDFFAANVGGDTLEVRKPDPRHLLETIARAGGTPGSAIMVGDSAIDVAAARTANIPVVGVSFGYTEIPMAEIGPDRLIDHFDQLNAAVADLLEQKRT